MISDGKKMSKRLKNYPDPEVIINEDGADALRYALHPPTAALVFSHGPPARMHSLTRTLRMYSHYVDSLP